MNKERIRESLEGLLKEKVSVYGYCSALDFDTLDDLYLARQEENKACPFEKRDSLEALISPQCLLPGAKGFVVVLIPYGPSEASLKPLYGRMASGTASLDYHQLAEDILTPLCESLEAEGVSCRILCDTSPLSDRAIAVRAGLGMIRRNGMFYHSKLGSYVHIASILMTLDLSDKDYRPISDPCGHCRRCVAACPGKAIDGDYTINSNRCVSWMTQKKELTDQESQVLGDRIYGCDVCQLICPANRTVKTEESPSLVAASVELKALLEIGNKDFKETYQQTAAGWRGKRTLQRNALAALGNCGGQEAVKIVESYLEDPRPIIRREAQRSIHKLKADIGKE